MSCWHGFSRVSTHDAPAAPGGEFRHRNDFYPTAIYRSSNTREERGQNGPACAPALAGPQHGRGYHRCAGAYAPRGHIPSEPAHASLIGTTNASACPSFARRVCLSSHSDEMICALNVRVRSLVCWQNSMDILRLSTEQLKVELWRYTVREHGLHIALPPASSPVSRPCCC